MTSPIFKCWRNNFQLWMLKKINLSNFQVENCSLRWFWSHRNWRPKCPQRWCPGPSLRAWVVCRTWWRKGWGEVLCIGIYFLILVLICFNLFCWCFEFPLLNVPWSCTLFYQWCQQIEGIQDVLAHHFGRPKLPNGTWKSQLGKRRSHWTQTSMFRVPF